MPVVLPDVKARSAWMHVEAQRSDAFRNIPHRDVDPGPLRRERGIRRMHTFPRRLAEPRRSSSSFDRRKPRQARRLQRGATRIRGGRHGPARRLLLLEKSSRRTEPYRTKTRMSSKIKRPLRRALCVETNSTITYLCQIDLGFRAAGQRFGYWLIYSCAPLTACNMLPMHCEWHLLSQLKSNRDEFGPQLGDPSTSRIRLHSLGESL